MMTRCMLLTLLLFVSAAANVGAADVTGRWKVTISIGNETITGMASLKPDRRQGNRLGRP